DLDRGIRLDLNLALGFRDVFLPDGEQVLFREDDKQGVGPLRVHARVVPDGGLTFRRLALGRCHGLLVLVGVDLGIGVFAVAVGVAVGVNVEQVIDVAVFLGLILVKDGPAATGDRLRGLIGLLVVQRDDLSAALVFRSAVGLVE